MPTLYVLGGRSNPAFYAAIADRLAAALPDFTLEVFEHRHHFDPPHRAEPERLARTLAAFWSPDRPVIAARAMEQCVRCRRAAPPRASAR
jgi:hypothetical protein